MKKYTVQAISSICKLTPHTLRAWERRYQVVSPKRSSGGQRLYSQEDLEKLQSLQRLIERGHKISTLAELNLNQLRQLLTGTEGISPQESQQVEELVYSLQKYELKKLRQKLEVLKLDYSIRGYLFSVILPLYEKVGHLVEQRKLNISQEHALTALIRHSLLQINPPLLYPLPNKLIALATPEGNLHEMGIIMGEILCKASQWETIYFGPNLPVDALSESIQALDVPYLLLGGLYPGNTAMFQDYLNKLDEKCKLRVILGGSSQTLQVEHFKNIQLEMKKDFLSLEKFLKQ